MTTRELLQQTLEAMDATVLTGEFITELDVAADALRAHLAKPEPEPVAWIQYEDGAVRMTTDDVTNRTGKWHPLYAMEMTK